jgi:hypothetical protein
MPKKRRKSKKPKNIPARESFALVLAIMNTMPKLGLLVPSAGVRQANGKYCTCEGGHPDLECPFHRNKRKFSKP